MQSPRKTEWPTLCVVVLCYGLFAISTVLAPHYNLIAATVLLTLSIALHSSLQHEVLHGHPFRWQWLSDLLVLPAIGLFVSYERFRETHLSHHMDPNLTDPYDDPESNYQHPENWARLNGIFRAVLRFNNTLLGRMLIGPSIGTAAFVAADIRSILKGDRAIIRAYVLHAIGLVPVIWWIATIGTLPVWAYVTAAYSGLSLLKIRTFLEHRAHESVPGRTVVIEDNGPLAFLFLNNNYHSVHHAHPQLPWFALPKFYMSRRASFLKRNQDYIYNNYAEVFRQYFLHGKDPVPHPLMAMEDNPHLKSDRRP